MALKPRLLFSLLLVTIGLKAQTDSIQASEKHYRDGMEAFNFSHRKQALEYFQKAIKANPENAKAHLMAGKSILYNMQKKQSLKYFKEALRLNPKIDEDILFLVGQSFHYAEQFDSALMYYEKFNYMLSRSLMFERSMKINEVNRKIFECRNAKVFKENPVDVLIEDLGKNVNSEFADYAPNISADESVLVFTSRRPEPNGSNTLADDLEYYEEILMSKRVNGQWQPSMNVGGPLNTAFHNANISLSPNGKEMFVYSDENGGDLYETELGDDSKWEKPKRLNGFINSPYLENSAAVTSDDKKLFFVSDRPGGYGGTDIYVAFKNKRGEWAEVQNLGSVINTDRDEEDVFVSANGQHIYFSSNGHAGMGDLDIYRSTFDSAAMQWSEPLNLGYPVNSVENDIYFVLSGDERYAYISSLRENSVGDQDLYRVDLKNWKPMTRKELMEKELTQAHLLTPVNVTATFNVPQNSIELKSVNEQKSGTNTPVMLTVEAVDEISGSPLNASVRLVDENKKEIVLEKSGNVYATTIQNQGYKKYQILAEALGYQSVRSTLHLMGNSDNNVIKESLSLRKIESNVPFVINLYYDVNQVTPNNPEALNMLKSLMLENPAAKVLVEGHTDNSGEADYNQQLSQRRVDAVKKILADAGIQAERIIATGYGESRPLTDNTTYNGRKLNRRTMFTIIK